MRKGVSEAAGEDWKHHGTLTGYATYYCRCLRCTEAHTVYHRQRRARNNP